MISAVFFERASGLNKETHHSETNFNSILKQRMLDFSSRKHFARNYTVQVSYIDYIFHTEAHESSVILFIKLHSTLAAPMRGSKAGFRYYEDCNEKRRAHLVKQTSKESSMSIWREVSA